MAFSRVDQKIRDLSTKVLNESELSEAESISAKLLGSEDECNEAIDFLKNKMGVRPKRPMYYLNWEIGFLPEHTRDLVRYAGDFIDELIKEVAYDKAIHFKSFALKRSLGSNIRKIRGALGDSLYGILNEYNEFIYVPAKHDFNTNGHPHRFSGPEAVYVCYITTKLIPMICALSPGAKCYAYHEQ